MKSRRVALPSPRKREFGALRFSDDYSSTPFGKYCKKDNTMYF